MTHDDLTDDPESHLEGLGERFHAALDARRNHDVDGAAEILRGILKVEPRLGEPHLELASILLASGQLDDAEEHAREAARILEAGGQWIDDLPDNVVLSLAWSTLAEVLRQQADADEVVFGDPEVWRALMEESKTAFATAARLDPSNDNAQGWSFGLSLGADDEALADEEILGENDD